MFRKYLWSRRVLLIAYLGQLALFIAVMAVFSMDLLPVRYAVLLSLFLFTLYLIYDFIKFSNTTRRLGEVEKQLSFFSQALPVPTTHTERQYQQLMAGLYELFDQTRQQLFGEQNEQLDYFTMWLHQIKTPLFAIRLALEREKRPNPVYAQELFNIERYVEMALQYVKARDLSTDLVIKECPLYELVAGAVKKYSTLFIYKGLKAEISLPELSVYTDGKWLSFILEQLISNAVKYTPAGGVYISMQNGLLEIRDTGIGIRQEDLPRLFEKGYTGYNGRLDRRASGIGLYMSKKVADALGITLTIESKQGGGTRALLRFPEQAPLALE